MKRMLFGSMLFIGGLIGALCFTAMALSSTISYDFYGSEELSPFIQTMMGQGTYGFFILACIIGVVGLIICGYEAYLKDFIVAQKAKNK